MGMDSSEGRPVFRVARMSMSHLRAIIFYKAHEFKTYGYEYNDIPISYETIERIQGLCQEIQYA
jgi:hypothetical protein